MKRTKHKYKEKWPPRQQTSKCLSWATFLERQQPKKLATQSRDRKKFSKHNLTTTVKARKHKNKTLVQTQACEALGLSFPEHDSTAYCTFQNKGSEIPPRIFFFSDNLHEQGRDLFCRSRTQTYRKRASTARKFALLCFHG
jgi:hypothetical protein